MAQKRHCPECGRELPPDAPQGICPQCLMKVGLPTAVEAPKPAAPDAQGQIPTSATPPAGFTPPDPKELADKFPQLEITELLGQGGMGAVYKARQKHLQRSVALKILPPEVSQDPAFAERFAREARSLARLSHPRIVAVHDFGHTDDGLYYFIMEYVDGTDLRQVIRAGHLSPSEALAIVPQICEALQFAHEEGIVHRDIKPENILIDKKGRVKIADFGLARLLNQPATAYTLTHPGQRMGTPHYMAPEQIEHPAEVDHRADIYSLGVVFYEMLTGELPIGRFAPPSRKVQVDVRLDEIVLHTLEKEPQLRYQQASELRTDVETVSATEHDAPPPPQPAPAFATAPKSSPMEKHITIIAALRIGFGVMGLIAGVLVLVAVLGGGIISRNPTALKATPIVGSFLFGLIALTSIPGIIGGIGLIKRRQWARILVIILGVLDILQIPIGTIIGIYTLWTLLNEETARLFNRASDPTRANRYPAGTQAAPHAAAAVAAAHSQAPPKAVAESSRRPFADLKDIRRRLRVPAIGLIIGGLISCFGIPIVFGGLILFNWLDFAGSPAWYVGIPGFGEIIMLIGSVIVGLIIIIGASGMRRLSFYGLAVTAGIVALLPCHPGSLITLPFGIWALVVLSRIDVQAAFARQSRDPNQPGSGALRAILLLIATAAILLTVGVLVVLGMHIWMPAPEPTTNVTASQPETAAAVTPELDDSPSIPDEVIVGPNGSPKAPPFPNDADTIEGPEPNRP